MKHVSAVLSVAVGLGCIGGFIKSQATGPAVQDVAASISPAAKVVARAPQSVERVARVAVRAANPDSIDTSLPTGSIEPGSALHRPNPAAYADAAKDGSSLILKGSEAVNYLAGNTLRREGAGKPLRYTYFASRGLQGDGDERGFVARPWDRNGRDLCDAAADGGADCRPIEILLDAKSELSGARLGTVTIGGSETATLIKGNLLHFPEHIPFLDSNVTAEAARVAPSGGGKGTAAWSSLVGHTAALAEAASGAARRTIYVAKDNRILDVAPVDGGDDKAVRVTVGHWRTSKNQVCQTRLIGDAAQLCFKAEAVADGSLRLTPTGKAGSAQVLTPLVETGAREVAQD